MSRSVVKSVREEDKNTAVPASVDNIAVPSLALGLVIFLVLLGVSLFVLSIYGGCVAIAKCHVALGICALVFTVFFPPVGFILAIVGICLGDNCLKALPTSLPLSTSLST